MSLAFETISAEASGTPILERVSLTLRRGELLAVLGPNGAGKSSLLQCLFGLRTRTDGEVRIDGLPAAQMTPPGRARKVAYLPQVRRFGWPVTVRDAVALGRYAYGASPGNLQGRDRAAVDAALSDCALEKLAERRVDTLSGGETARVHCARLFAAQTPYIVADEPAEALDPFHQIAVLDLFRKAADGGAGVLLVLHDLDLAARYADRVAILKDGALYREGPPGTVLTPGTIRSVYGVRSEVSQGRILVG